MRNTSRLSCTLVGNRTTQFCWGECFDDTIFFRHLGSLLLWVWVVRQVPWELFSLGWISFTNYTFGGRRRVWFAVPQSSQKLGLWFSAVVVCCCGAWLLMRSHRGGCQACKCIQRLVSCVAGKLLTDWDRRTRLRAKPTKTNGMFGRTNEPQSASCASLRWSCQCPSFRTSIVWQRFGIIAS